METKPMTVGEWEKEVESLINRLQDLSLACNFRDEFESGKMSGFQYAKYHLENLLKFSRRGDAKGND